MSSCQGELPGKTFAVRAVDRTGTEVFNGDVTTLKNGFFEIWLPRDRSLELTIQGMGRKAAGRIGTFRGSDTCLTTFQLK